MPFKEVLKLFGPFLAMSDQGVLEHFVGFQSALEHIRELSKCFRLVQAGLGRFGPF